MPTPPARPPAPVLPATQRFCEALARFGLAPAQCLHGAGARYDAALRQILAAAGRPS